MNELDQKALENLRSLAKGQTLARETGREVALQTGDIVGVTYRRTIIAGDGSGTQQIVAADNSRIAFVVSDLGSNVVIDIESPVASNVGLALGAQDSFLLIHKRDFGRLVTYAWFGNIIAATDAWVLEILQS